MLPHKQRVVEEKEQLEDRLTKLTSFISTSHLFPALPKAEQKRLLRQLKVMQEYSEILSERIAAF